MAGLLCGWAASPLAGTAGLLPLKAASFLRAVGFDGAASRAL